eukprot:584936_1
MGSVNGLCFLIYFCLECHLALYWMETIDQTCEVNQISFLMWNRYLLLIAPLMTALDNLRFVFGSILSKSQCQSTISETVFHSVSFMHLVCLPPFVASCMYFSITPKVTSEHTQNGTILTSILWLLSCVVTLIFALIGIYTFVASRSHIVFHSKYGIHQFETDKDWLSRANVVVKIGYQIPVTVSMVTLVMNSVIWYHYQYAIPFCITFISIVGMGSLASSSPTGFFFFCNLFEYTLFVQYYLVDRFLFYNPDDLSCTAPV